MRKIMIAVIASMTVVVGSVDTASSALAADELVQVSSLASGVYVTGTYSTTVTADTSWAAIDFPAAYFTLPTWAIGRGQGGCTEIGVTLAINGVVQQIGCQSFRLADPEHDGETYFDLYADTQTIAHAGDVITLSWGYGVVFSIASLSEVRVWLQDPSTSELIEVTLPFEPPAPSPMWQQAIGRASDTATCPDGYTPSWDTWPNGGKGGYVCNRFVPVYGS